MPRVKRTICIYEDDQGRCNQTGRGDPPLCDAHNDVEFEYEEFIDTALEHPRIAGILDKVTEVVDLGKKFVEKLSKGENPLGNVPKNKPQPKVVVKGPTPREVLHFGPTELITPEKLKERKRALAHMAHPDKGGSKEEMARIIEAAKAIEKEMKEKC